MKSSLIKLIARIEDTPSNDVTLKDVRVLVKCGDPEVIGALAGLLDDEGRVGREAARGLAHFGRAAEATLRRCLESPIETVARRAAELLAALGDDTALRENEVVDQENEAAAVVAEQVAGNDNEEIPAAELANLTDPEVVRAVTKVLVAQGVAKQDLDAGVAEVQTRVLELLRVAAPPVGVKAWEGLAVKVAVDFALDVRRHRQTRRKFDAEMDEEEGSEDYAIKDHSEWDPVDRGRMLDIFREALAMGELPPMANEIVHMRAIGMTDEEIGEEIGISRKVVNKRRLAIHARMRRELMRRGMSELVVGCGLTTDERVGDALNAAVQSTRK